MKKGSKVDIIYVNVANTNFKTTKENAMMLNTNTINIMQEDLDIMITNYKNPKSQHLGSLKKTMF